MLIQLKMKFWRKHVDKTINFTAGLNAIRGANENGKSSMLLAISYALWGAKLMPLPMAEMVTWGQPEKDAKVDLTMSVNGEMYHFSRSTNGAECNHSGGVVTGQNEVSKFATELMGVGPDLAMKLMFSTQGGLRGALDAGPTAISAYIEDMSGMDLFDILLEKCSDKLTTGPTTIIDAAIATLNETLENGGPVEPDLTDLKANVALFEKALGENETLLVAAEVTAAKANDAFTEAKAKIEFQESSQRNLKRAEEGRDRRLAQQKVDTEASEQVVDEPRIDYLVQMIADGTALQARKQGYTAFSALPATEVEWEGDEASLKADIKAKATRIAEVKSQISTATADIRVLNGQLTTASICGFCDQDMSKFPAVAKKNTETEAAIVVKDGVLALLNTSLAELVEDHQDHVDLLEAASPSKAFLQRHGALVEVDDQFVPPHITWVGQVPTGDTDVAGMQVELKNLKAALAAKTAATDRLVHLADDIAHDEGNIAELRSSLTEVTEITPLSLAKGVADAAVVTYTKGIRESREKLQNLEANKSRLLAEYKLAVQNFAKVSVDLAEKKSQREALVFNNTLIKKIKAARPIVAGKLWALVLTSVSVMFTNMRGEQSVVTKGPKGFLVNGRPSEAISGSGLDLLGFAIRVAMLNTFIPQCSFLILDEATSACDDDRTASLLGFIASAGFPQTLLVTHELASESVADNVVMI